MLPTCGYNGQLLITPAAGLLGDIYVKCLDQQIKPDPVFIGNCHFKKNQVKATLNSSALQETVYTCMIKIWIRGRWVTSNTCVARGSIEWGASEISGHNVFAYNRLISGCSGLFTGL